MKFLHLSRSEPEKRVRSIIAALSRGEESREVRLYDGPVDYARLVAEIFESDRVICWW
jgi:hypothetical protein